MANVELTTQFIASMPAAYAQAFDRSDAEEHADIVQRRSAAGAEVVVWRTLPRGDAILCVVADDRPGLVALVSAAFLAHALDVRFAQIFCRERGDGQREAVDFFWLRSVSPGAPVDVERVAACTRTIRELLASELEGASVPDGRAGGDAGARVTHAPDPSADDRFEITLEARDFPGLLHTVARLLHQHGLEVVRCEIRTEEGIARDRFWVTAFDGQPAPPKLEAFRAALLGVISAIHKSEPPPPG